MPERGATRLGRRARIPECTQSAVNADYVRCSRSPRAGTGEESDLLGQKSKRAGVGRAHDREVAVIDGGDIDETEVFRDSDE